MRSWLFNGLMPVRAFKNINHDSNILCYRSFTIVILYIDICQLSACILLWSVVLEASTKDRDK